MLTGCASSSERKREKQRALAAATAYTQLGAEYLREGRYELSLTKLQQALELDPDYAKAHGAIAILYEKVGDQKLAEKHYKKALHLELMTPVRRTTLGSFCVSRGVTKRPMSSL